MVFTTKVSHTVSAAFGTFNYVNSPAGIFVSQFVYT